MGSNFDHIVVGAGIQGSATAYQLAKAGKRTLLLEQFPLPHTRGSSHGGSRIIRNVQTSEECVKLVMDSYEQWAELEIATKQTLFKKTGLLWMTDREGANRRSALLKRFNLPHELIAGPNVVDRFPQFNYDGSWAALYDPHAGVLYANKCLQAFQDEFVRMGGVIRDGEKVLAYTAGETVGIKTERGTYTAKSVVFCAGPWVGKVFNELNLHVQPTAVKVCYWRANNSSHEFEPENMPCVIVTRNNTDLYGLPIVEYPGLVKLCAHEGTVVDPDYRDVPSFHNGIDPTIASPRDHVAEHIKGLDSAWPGVVDTCIYTVTPDNQFILDTHPDHPNVVIGGGFSGAGFKFAPTIGSILAALAQRIPVTKFDMRVFSITRNFDQTEQRSKL